VADGDVVGEGGDVADGGDVGDDSDVGAGPDVDRMLLELGAALGAALATSVPSWVVSQVMRLADAWVEVGGASLDVTDVRADAVEAGRRAAADVADQLAVLLAADVDAQSTTPLAVVRGAVSYPSAVLQRAGVPPVVRDAFDEERFPDDRYGLIPASLAAVDPSLTDLARAWGAAKAMAHKHRHGQPSSA
jgi:hypothetical protein